MASSPPFPTEAIYSCSVDLDVMMPMRDSVHLATDLYWPVDDAGRRLQKNLGTVLVRTSYNKTNVEWDGVPEYYVARGFVFIIQDLRSRYKSEGDGRYHHTCNPWEGDDGYDTVEWIAAQPWSNGRVGMMGSSHRAIVQTQAALYRPPHLTTICPEQGPTNIYLHEAREGGAMALHMYTAICNHALDAHEIRDDEQRVAQVAQALADATDWLQKLPPKPDDNPLIGVPHLQETLFDYFYRGEYDDWWSQDCNDQTPYWDNHADIPCLITGGWFDPFIDGTTEYFESMVACNETPTRMIVGPWGHGTMRVNTTSLGDVDFGPEAEQGYPAHNELRVRWFDRWLRDASNCVEEDPPVEIFVMGGGSGRRTAQGLLDHGGKWRAEEAWPIERTFQETHYLTVQGGLAGEPPISSDRISYDYDPAHPVPSAGGNLAHLFALDLTDEITLDPVAPFGQRASTYRQHREIVPWGPMDQREQAWMLGDRSPGARLADRPDVLTFETHPLQEDTEVTGQPVVNLWVSSSAPDTDITAKLVDVYPPNEDYPEGYEMNVTDTVLRMRYRNSWTDPEMMESGKIYSISIALPATSNSFQAGHRIRLDVSSSNFPRLEPNPNTGEPVGRHTRVEVATNTLHVGADTPSNLVLPVIPPNR
ncbi:MAG: antibiotic hydrolase [Gemmatimonadetes bacterium]|nr:antibiotic hydrolase [Gemmatimonadota bacterium]|tara:strand:- start:7488 stop:9428 length:1941 start_codon:yes stop_codon:yes gene_type:complete